MDVYNSLSQIFTVPVRNLALSNKHFYNLQQLSFTITAWPQKDCNLLGCQGQETFKMT